jgi:hypothetical protein
MKTYMLLCNVLAAASTDEHRGFLWACVALYGLSLVFIVKGLKTGEREWLTHRRLGTGAGGGIPSHVFVIMGIFGVLFAWVCIGLTHGLLIALMHVGSTVVAAAIAYFFFLRH